MRQNVVPIERGSTAPTSEEIRKQMRADLRARLESLKPDAQATKTSVQLFDTLEAYDPTAGQDKTGQARLVETVKRRMDRLRKVDALDSEQARDLMIIVLFGERKLPPDMRLDACALLQLGGKDAVVKTLCRAYPGFRKALTE